jgi:hypothetical protein
MCTSRNAEKREYKQEQAKCNNKNQPAKQRRIRTDKKQGNQIDDGKNDNCYSNTPMPFFVNFHVLN